MTGEVALRGGSSFLACRRCRCRVRLVATASSVKRRVSQSATGSTLPRGGGLSRVPLRSSVASGNGTSARCAVSSQALGPAPAELVDQPLARRGALQLDRRASPAAVGERGGGSVAANGDFLDRHVAERRCPVTIDRRDRPAVRDVLPPA